MRKGERVLKLRGVLERWVLECWSQFSTVERSSELDFYWNQNFF